MKEKYDIVIHVLQNHLYNKTHGRFQRGAQTPPPLPGFFKIKKQPKKNGSI